MNAFPTNTLTKLFILLALNFFLTNAVVSQSVGEIDLKDGTVIRGQIVEFKYPSHVLMKVGDSTVRFEWKDILRVNFDQGATSKTQTIDRVEYKLRDSAFYASLSPLGLNFGLNKWNDVVAAYSIDAGFGYAFSRRLNIGVNVGHDLYLNWPNHGFLTYSVQAFTRFRAESFTPTMGLIAGYGSPTSHPYNGVGEFMRGGLMINPSLGILKTIRKSSSFYFNAGYKWQWASAKEMEWFWNGNDNIQTLSDVKLRFNRLDFRIGFYIQ